MDFKFLPKTSRSKKTPHPPQIKMFQSNSTTNYNFSILDISCHEHHFLIAYSVNKFKVWNLSIKFFFNKHPVFFTSWYIDCSLWDIFIYIKHWDETMFWKMDAEVNLPDMLLAYSTWFKRTHHWTFWIPIPLKFLFD